MRGEIEKPWKVLHVSRKPSANGVAVLVVARPSGTVVEIPLFPSDLRRIVIQAAVAMDTEGES